MLGDVIRQTLLVSIDILNETSGWLVISFAIAGLLHNILTPEMFQRTLGNKSFAALCKATVSGMLLPICSCGVIPLGLGLYYSGAYLGPVLAFMVATPIINPAAVIMAFGLLGPQIAVIYLVTGFVVPMLIGIMGNTLGGRELTAPGVGETKEPVSLEDADQESLRQKILAGLEWGFVDLGVQVSKYVVPGILIAGLITAAVSPSIIQQYLGNPGVISIFGISVLGAIMYVCAVGHIPFIAALVASGAAPGVAITFLMSGAATNLPELISIYKLIGKRTTAIYCGGVVTFSMLVGYLTNKILLPGFTPHFDLSKSQHAIGLANKLNFGLPDLVSYLCSILVLGLFLFAYWPSLKLLVKKQQVKTMLLLVLPLIFAGCSSNHVSTIKPEKTVLPAQVSEWQQKNPQYRIETWAQGDLNDDGRDDAVIIYRVDQGRCQMVVALSINEGYQITEPVRAPVSNQQIQFKDIDEQPPTELIISGMKGSNVGYGIFRIEKGQVIDVFGSNMDLCC
ncbi:MAG: efflux transporter SaoE [Thermoanaerobacterales bacterium]|nr:efflux transporter SaoE [Thermoanaerobacterales bacterium]